MFDLNIYTKLARYCAYRDRCLSEVISKLKLLKAEKEDFAAYAERLKNEKFLNEERFVKAFVGAHARKKWGKTKIRSHLLQKRVESSLIKKYLDELDEGGYLEQIKTVAAKKLKGIKAGTKQELKTKLLRFLLSKGYEMGKAIAVMKELKI
jgi:regulatory protein